MRSHYIESLKAAVARTQRAIERSKRLELTAKGTADPLTSLRATKAIDIAYNIYRHSLAIVAQRCRDLQSEYATVETSVGPIQTTLVPESRLDSPIKYPAALVLGERPQSTKLQAIASTVPVPFMSERPKPKKKQSKKKQKGKKKAAKQESEAVIKQRPKSALLPRDHQQRLILGTTGDGQATDAKVIPNSTALEAEAEPSEDDYADDGFIVDDEVDEDNTDDSDQHSFGHDVIGQYEAKIASNRDDDYGDDTNEFGNDQQKTDEREMTFEEYEEEYNRRIAFGKGGRIEGPAQRPLSKHKAKLLSRLKSASRIQRVSEWSKIQKEIGMLLCAFCLDPIEGPAGNLRALVVEKVLRLLIVECVQVYCCQLQNPLTNEKCRSFVKEKPS